MLLRVCVNFAHMIFISINTFYYDFFSCYFCAFSLIFLYSFDKLQLGFKQNVLFASAYPYRIAVNRWNRWITYHEDVQKFSKEVKTSVKSFRWLSSLSFASVWESDLCQPGIIQIVHQLVCLFDNQISVISTDVFDLHAFPCVYLNSEIVYNWYEYEYQNITSYSYWAYNKVTNMILLEVLGLSFYLAINSNQKELILSYLDGLLCSLRYWEDTGRYIFR